MPEECIVVDFFLNNIQRYMRSTGMQGGPFSAKYNRFPATWQEYSGHMTCT